MVAAQVHSERRTVLPTSDPDVVCMSVADGVARLRADVAELLDALRRDGLVHPVAT